MDSKTNSSRDYQRRSSFIGSTQTSHGYTLIEVVTTVVVIGVLAGISVPKIGNMITYSRIDEAKALLNTAAADCLQKTRINDDEKDVIDDAIISDKRVLPIGFKIDKANNADKCSYFQLIPTDIDDKIRFPIGFSVSEGALSKFANPTVADKGSINSCETWAGVNCKQDKSLKALIEWKNQIASNKAICEDNYTKWLTESNTTPYQFQRWNPNAESGCPIRPPKDGSESYKTSTTCTTNGCNRVVFGLDGEFVGFTKDEYDRALEEKYGKACREWVNQKELANYTNNPIDLPQKKKPECGEQQFWFVDGVDYGSKAKLDARLREKASEKCDADREEARKSGFIGKWGPKEGPGVCAEESYICDRKIVSEYEYYKTCGAAPSKCKTNLRASDQECTDYELSDYWYKKCGPRPKDPPPKNCKYVGRGKPRDKTGWDKTPQCGAWARCMNLF